MVLVNHGARIRVLAPSRLRRRRLNDRANDDTMLVNLDSVRYCRSSLKTPDKTTFMFDENQSLLLDISIQMVESLTRR
jgi:hypothetical protein